MADIFLDEKNSSTYVTARRQLAGTRLYYNYLFDIIIDILPDQPSENVVILDLFSGHGDLAKRVEKRYGAGICISADLSIEMLNWNTRQIRVQCDACDLPLASGSVDAVVICGGLHHLNENQIITGLKAIHSVLKEGGLLIFCEPADDNLLIRFIRYVFYRIMPNLGNREEDESILFVPEMIDRLEENEFLVESVNYTGNIGYALLSQTDVLNFTQKIARNITLSKVLLKIEKLFQELPFTKLYSFAFVMACKKKPIPN